MIKSKKAELKEYDLVELTVDRDCYTRHGIYKGMQGIICYEKCVEGYSLVEFSLYGEGGCIAVIDVRDVDLCVITQGDDWINDRIKAEREGKN